MEDEKIIKKLSWVIEEIQRELKGNNKEVKDLNSLLEKIIKNCEVSIKLTQDYQTAKDLRNKVV
jgi:wobble nucleotide-excising tRNase